MPSVSNKMLTQTLRDMEDAGLVIRHVQRTIPPVMEYRLTALVSRFVELIELLYV